MVLILAAATPVALATASSVTIAPGLVDGSKSEFVEHAGDGQWDSYLAMNLPFEPAAETFKQLLLRERRQLTNRGEAHITVVTPVEYWSVLRAKVPIAKVNEIARSAEIQKSKVEVVCIGRGRAMVDGKEEFTFYVVARSSALLAIRKKILEAFVREGGDSKAFDPANYHPHVTIGFTKRDLHESDGVIKDAKSCRE